MEAAPGLEPGNNGFAIRNHAGLTGSEGPKTSPSPTPPADSPAVRCSGAQEPSTEPLPAESPGTGEERELRELAKAWPSLSPAIKAAIKALLNVEC